MQCLASSVWKKFIFPPFSHLRSDEEEPSASSWSLGKNSEFSKSKISEVPRPVAQLDFTEDDPEALHIHLSIAHLRVKEIPHLYIPYQKLLHLALLCDQYDCAALLTAYVHQWLPKQEKKWRKVGEFGWLWISFAFGKHFMFQHLATHLVKQISVDAEGLFIPHTNGGLRYLSLEELPPGVEGRSEPMCFCSC